jgi:tetratricopeptide (TPR) repeat protein
MKHLGCALLFALVVNSFGHVALAATFRTTSQQAQLDKAARLNEEAQRLYGQGRAREAIASAKQALTICEDVYGENHTETATALNNAGMMLQAIGDYATARSCHERALAI